MERCDICTTKETKKNIFSTYAKILLVIYERHVIFLQIIVKLLFVIEFVSVFPAYIVFFSFCNIWTTLSEMLLYL